MGRLEERAAGNQVLISIHDEATSRLTMVRFVERDPFLPTMVAIAPGHFKVQPVEDSVAPETASIGDPNTVSEDCGF